MTAGTISPCRRGSRNAGGDPGAKWDDLDAVVDPDGVGPRLFFERWDAGEPNKRVHLDVNALAGEELSPEEREQRLAEERRRLEALGAGDRIVATQAACRRGDLG